MIGIDLVDVARIAEMNCDKFINKYLTTQEQEYLKTKNTLGVKGKESEYNYTLAGIWATKEAVLKALGVGLNVNFDIKEIEIFHENSGKPFVILSKNIQNKFKIDKNRVEISISHDAGVAISIVKIG